LKIFPSQQKIFTKEEEKSIIQAIKEAEFKTSGEIRVHVEQKKEEDLKQRALEIFEALGMRNTKEKNGVLIYLNVGSKHFLVMGDEGIHNKVGQVFWEDLSTEMGKFFTANRFAEGTTQGIHRIGEELKKHFPFNPDTDTNELDDEISYQI